LLTINPRGGLFISDEFLNGEGAHPAAMILGPVEERIIIGNTDLIHEDVVNFGPARGEPVVQRSLNGWLAAATAAEPYNDPCIEPYNFLP
jgi:hypothetical protein